MNQTRRAMLGLISAGMMLPAHLVQAQSETARLQREIDDATTKGKPWQAPAGRLLVGELRLPDNAHLIGVPGRTRIMVSGAITTAARPGRITLEGITFDGMQRPGGRDKGLVQLSDVADLRITDCAFERFGGNGMVLERCGGRIVGSSFREHGRAGLFALDSTGLAIEGNRVEHCGENGILVWRSARGEDGTIVRGNRIQDIRADAGGTGEYGNAIGIYRAGGVIAEGNVMRRLAYTAVRNNSGSNVIIANNNIAACGEAAIFVEFAFDGVAVTGNIVDGAMGGINLANFLDHKGHLGVVSGNVLRNLREGIHPGDKKLVGGIGIFVEADAAITGNTIDNAQRIGIQLGWGQSLRDVTVSGNMIRDCDHGIGISVVPGAGKAAVSGNSLAGIRKQAIIGKQWDKLVTGDLAKTGAKDWPNIQLGENMLR